MGLAKRHLSLDSPDKIDKRHINLDSPDDLAKYILKGKPHFIAR
jgi:hypothetical protein